VECLEGVGGLLVDMPGVELVVLLLDTVEWVAEKVA
jgi:hypothetical protein